MMKESTVCGISRNHNVGGEKSVQLFIYHRQINSYAKIRRRRRSTNPRWLFSPLQSFLASFFGLLGRAKTSLPLLVHFCSWCHTCCCCCCDGEHACKILSHHLHYKGVCSWIKAALQLKRDQGEGPSMAIYMSLRGLTAWNNLSI